MLNQDFKAGRQPQLGKVSREETCRITDTVHFDCSPGLALRVVKHEKSTVRNSVGKRGSNSKMCRWRESDSHKEGDLGDRIEIARGQMTLSQHDTHFLQGCGGSAG